MILQSIALTITPQGTPHLTQINGFKTCYLVLIILFSSILIYHLRRMCQYGPVCLNKDLPETNITVEWIVQLGTCHHEYLIYKVFRQKSEVFSIRVCDSDSGLGIKFCYFTSMKRLFLSKFLERIISRALSCFIRRTQLVCWLYAKIQEYYNPLIEQVPVV